MSILKSWQVLVKMRTHEGLTAVRLNVELMAMDPALACVSAYAVAKRDAMHTAAVAHKKLPKIAAVSFLVRPVPESKTRPAPEVTKQ
jgi:hypothetical protein